MKKFVARYMLYIYIKFIKNEDLEILKNWAKPIMKPIIFTHDVFVWIFSIIFFPILIIGMKIENSKRILKIKNIYS